MNYTRIYVVTLSCGKTIAFPDLGLNIDFDEHDLHVFIEKYVAPLVAKGQTHGQLSLRVRTSKKVITRDGEIEQLSPPYILKTHWEAHLPWWHPDNPEWWKSPVCDHFIAVR